jgi:methanol dehydrogenase (cytochrome c) subunit 1
MNHPRNKGPSASAIVGILIAGCMLGGFASANERLISLSQSDENWVMPGKNYASGNYSKMTQINRDNVKRLKVSCPSRQAS